MFNGAKIKLIEGYINGLEGIVDLYRKDVQELECRVRILEHLQSFSEDSEWVISYRNANHEAQVNVTCDIDDFPKMIKYLKEHEGATQIIISEKYPPFNHE
jgi:hypothetical protein